MAEEIEDAQAAEIATEALSWAVRSNNLAGVRLALRNGADVDALIPPTGRAPIHMAAANGFAVIVQELLGQGADPGVRTTTGVTPFMLAAQCARADTLHALVSYVLEDDSLHAHLTAKDDEGRDCLHYANVGGSTACGDYLLRLLARLA